MVSGSSRLIDASLDMARKRELSHRCYYTWKQTKRHPLPTTLMRHISPDMLVGLGPAQKHYFND
jgi:hypothetical protein